MAVGNVLGYAAGSYGHWDRSLTFTKTKYCDVNCANLKSAFVIHLVILACTTYVSVSSSHETPFNALPKDEEKEEGEEAQKEAGASFYRGFINTLKAMDKSMWIIFTVTAFSWVGWFPFVLYDTDWMGREVYKGDPSLQNGYSAGVRTGAFGLMLNSIVLGLFSWKVDAVCDKIGSGLVWGLSSLLMALCFAAMVVISFWAKHMDYDSGHPTTAILTGSLIVFALLGLPFAVTFSVPYALVSIKSEDIGVGQGLALGLLNLAIVFPQMIVSLLSGPLDEVVGGGNWGSLCLGAISAFVSGITAMVFIHIRASTRRLSPR